MDKLRVALLYGGRSGEHEVSIRSARSIYETLKKKHSVFPIFIDKNGFWWRIDIGIHELPANAAELKERVFLYPGFSEPQLNTAKAQLKIDIVFPVLHGTHGEDGVIQGALESAGIPYVGAGVAASAVGMDKAMMKALFDQAGLPVVPYLWFYRSKWKKNQQEIIDQIETNLPYPIFVKPVNLGSSVGIHKVHDRGELPGAFDDAARYDQKVIVEKGINAREFELSVLGNEQPEASLPGELIPKREFYDYAAKYIEDTTKLKIPAQLEYKELEEMQKLAVRAFVSISCSGMARVDLFLDRDTQIIYLNEINTIPGFTNISMYPKLWEASGLTFADLLDRLLELGLERFRDLSQNVTSYDAIQDV